jgi:hypothetical protein
MEYGVWSTEYGVRSIAEDIPFPTPYSLLPTAVAQSLG